MNHVTITVLEAPRKRPRRGPQEGDGPRHVLEVEVQVEHKTARNADGLEAIRTTLEVSGEEMEQYEAGTLSLEDVIAAHYEELEAQLDEVIVKANAAVESMVAAVALPVVTEALNGGGKHGE
jgi:hypothetical protein